MKEKFRSTDKPKKRKRTSYEPASQAVVRAAIKKAHSRIVGDGPLRKVKATEDEKPMTSKRANEDEQPMVNARAGQLTERLS